MLYIKGFIATAILSAFINSLSFNECNIRIKSNILIQIFFFGFDLYICAVIGLIITGLIIWITEYYTGTSFRPVKSVAQSSTTGHGTNVIQGLAISMEATAIPALIIVVGIIIY